ncbi:hypothetical protein Hanom_Chr09g00770731 [Helianthus anomalus]
MWMFVLVMMVLTRTRSEDDSRVLTTQSTAEGSASTKISCPNRRRKLNSTNTSYRYFQLFKTRCYTLNQNYLSMTGSRTDVVNFGVICIIYELLLIMEL